MDPEALVPAPQVYFLRKSEDALAIATAVAKLLQENNGHFK